MQKLEISIEDELNILEKYNLTYEEWMLIKLLFLAEEDRPDLLAKYYSFPVNEGKLRPMLREMQEKGIILKSYVIPEHAFDPRDVEFNKIFLKNYMKSSIDMIEELMSVYPSFITIGGITYDLKNYAKKFNSDSEFAYAYGKSIGFREKTHKEVIALVKWAKENTDFLNNNIANFVISKQWERIRELQDGDYNGLTFDTMKMV